MPTTTDSVPAGRRLSILHVAQPTDHGVAVCVAALAHDQVQRGWEVAVACPDTGRLPDEVVDAGAAHHVWPADRAPHRALARERTALAAAITAARPDVVHLHSAKAGLSGRALVRGGRPTLFQPHAWSYEALDGRTRQAAVAWERTAARWADVIVCCSQDEEASGRRAGVRGTFEVVPNGVDLERFRPATGDERHAARRELGLRDGPVAVCVGRLSPQKGQDLLVRAWPTIAAGLDDASLVVVGEGPAERELRDLAAGRPDIRLVGGRDDVPRWLAVADVAVLPSRYEGMALGVIEAIASGVSVVASSADGMAEVLGTGDEAAGAIVPVEDVAALAVAVRRRFDDPQLRAREAAAGRRRAEARHDRRAWTERLAALAAQAADRRTP